MAAVGGKIKRTGRKGVDFWGEGGSYRGEEENDFYPSGAVLYIRRGEQAGWLTGNLREYADMTFCAVVYYCLLVEKVVIASLWQFRTISSLAVIW